MSVVDTGSGDEELLAALRHALLARQAVPADFVAAGKSAFAWHDIDAELARLTYDSSRDADQALSTRTEAASIRALTFTSPHMTIELEVAHDSLLGQIVPAQAGVIKVQPQAGAERAVSADEIGCFSIYPIPSGSFRLQCRTQAGLDIVTGWISL